MHPDSPRRRVMLLAATLVVGAVLLGTSLRADPGGAAFFALSSALAACWCLGGLAAGPVPWAPRRPGAETAGSRWRVHVLVPLLAGVGAVAVFAAGGLLVTTVPVLRDRVADVIAYAEVDVAPTVVLIAAVTGAAEEVFFRGALFGAVSDRRPVVVTTAVYTVVTMASGNVMLVLAAAVLGVVVGLLRQRTGGVTGPIVTHVTWSMGMLFLLPPIVS